MIIENVIRVCTGVKIIQYLLKEEPRIIMNATICNTGGVYDHINNELHDIEYQVYKADANDSGIVIGNRQSDSNALMSLNTMFYHHNNTPDLTIYGSRIDSRSTERYSIPIKKDFQYYKDPRNLNKTIDKHGNSVAYALVLNALCREMNLESFKMSPAKITEFLNDCLSSHWYEYYKGIL